MSHKQLIIIFLALYLILYTLYSPTVFAQTNDVTPQIENLGNPFKTKWPDSNTNCRYARNVWDMLVFEDKIYLGSGNSANSGPCVNGGAGGTPLMVYNPTTSSFANEFNITEEQIDYFKILNSQLVIPGHDPSDGGAYVGNWYRLENTGWKKYRNIEGGVHMYDMVSFDNKLIAAVVSEITSFAVVSSDNGQTWVDASANGFWRAWRLITVGGKLYLTFASLVGLGDPQDNVFEYNPATMSFTPLPDLRFAHLFPSTPATLDTARINRPNYFLNSLVYIGDQVVNDHQGDPFGIYKLTSITPSSTDAVRITLPNNPKPWDILVKNNKLYVLGSIQNGSRFWVTVTSTPDLINWTEEFRFDSPLFARSFENLNNSWYFGLGTDAANLSISTGDILKYQTITSSPSPSPSTSPSPSPSPSPTKTGDINLDGEVDIFDYNQLIIDFGKTGTSLISDIDKNADSADKVDIFDYNLLLTNFNK